MQQLVVFALGGEYFGINIAIVERIVKMQTITHLPQSPEYVIGITDFPETLLPVIDLRIRFGLCSQAISRQTSIMIVMFGGIKVGVLVDGVSEVLRVPDDQIEAVPSMVSTVNSAFIKGIVRLENRLVILLELSKVLNLKERAALAEMV